MNNDQAFIDGFIKAAFANSMIPPHGGVGAVMSGGMSGAIPQPGTQPQPGQPQPRPAQTQPQAQPNQQLFAQLLQQYKSPRVQAPPPVQPQF